MTTRNSFAVKPLVFLVRHTAVELVEGLSPAEWPASPEGIAAAERLATAPALAGVRLVAASPEAKAVATAEPIARRLDVAPTVEPALREVERPPGPIVSPDEIARMVRTYLGSGGSDGWEPPAQARQRIAACINRLCRSSPGPLVVVSHGLALTLYREDSEALWETMPLPAVAVAAADGIGDWMSIDDFLSLPAPAAARS